MKIDSIECCVVKEPVKYQYRWREGLRGSGTETIKAYLRIRTDDGVEGFSVCSHGTIVADLVDRTYGGLFLGTDPLLSEAAWHRVWEMDRLEEYPMYALGVADIALWDIKAQAAGMPLYKLLGGFREKIPAYASTVTFESLDEYSEIVAQCIDVGYGAFKLHAWGDTRRDAELSEKLREWTSPDTPLMFDGSAGWDYVDALWFGRRLEGADFLWYEEPCREFDLESYAKLTDKLDIPMLVAETSDGCHWNAANFIRSGAGDLIRASASYKGGITGAIKVAHLAEAFGMRAEVHGGGLPNLHIALAVPNNTFYEDLVICHDQIASRSGDSTIPLGSDGTVSAPTEAGIGWTFNWDDLSKRAIHKIELR